MFEKIDIYDKPLKIFNMIDKDWMLVTAGDINNHNTMTASWGGFGILWHNPVATIYIRPQRYTRQFLDSNKYFTLSFYNKKYKDILQFCGTVSGRNVNKDEKTKLTPQIFGNGIAYKESCFVVVCEKQYRGLMDSSFILKQQILDSFYKENDFPYIYIGKIIETYILKPNV